MDNILNMGAARRELAEHGRTAVVMLLAERFRPFITWELNNRSRPTS
ncbi:hypothetical protein [Streptomyces sp. NPDC096013]